MNHDYDYWRSGDYVRLHDRLTWLITDFPDNGLWEGEPLDCVFLIEKVDSLGVDFNCVKECGGHAVTSLSRNSYALYCEALGDSLFKISSVSEAIQESIEKEWEYNPEEEATRLLQFFARGATHGS